MAEIETLYIENDNLIRLSGLRDGAHEIYLNGATVTVTLVDAASGEEIDGETWPLTMDYISGTDGSYHAILPYDLALTGEQPLKAIVVADSGPGLRMSLRVPVIARYRDEE